MNSNGSYLDYVRNRISTIGDNVILESHSSSGWITFRLDGHLCQARVYDEPSQFGIDGGRVSILTIARGAEWEGLDGAVYNYDRGLDFDRTPVQLLQNVLEFCNSLPTE